MRSAIFSTLICMCIVTHTMSCSRNDPRIEITTAIIGYSPTTYLDATKGRQQYVRLQATDILHLDIQGAWAYAAFRQNQIVGEVVLHRDSQRDAGWAVLRVVYFEIADNKVQLAAIGKTRALSHISPPEDQLLKWKGTFFDAMKKAGVTEFTEQEYDKVRGILSQV